MAGPTIRALPALNSTEWRPWADEIDQNTRDAQTRLATIEANPPGQGNVYNGGGFGPNWVAANNAPTSIKNAIVAAGGAQCDGTADQVQINAQLAAYGEVMMSEGQFNLSATITPTPRRKLSGQGPTTILNGASGLTGSFIFLTGGDHFVLNHFLMQGGSEAAGTHHIDSNITSQSGFITGADACVTIHNVVSRNCKGDGIRIVGGFNRDSKLTSIHVWNAVGRGFFFDSPDGNVSQIVSGTCGGHGCEMVGSNWHVSNSKMWYSDKDGFRVSGARHTLSAVEGQDCAWAGIRLTGSLITLDGWVADSNSYEGTANQNVHSGLEVGLTETGVSSGGYDITIGPGQSWDKNESARGFMQRYGVRLRSGIRGLTMVGVQTGNPDATAHKNVSGGIFFNTAADLNHASNFVTGCLNHYVRMQSA